MFEVFDKIEVEGIGSEVLSFGFVVIINVVVISLVWLAWKSTVRRALEYELFLVEMHTLGNRRVVEVLHVGSHYRPRDSYAGLLERMRSRVRNRHADDGRWVAVSDTNVVIQSPSTVTGNGLTDIPRDPLNRLTLWEIDIPLDTSGTPPDSLRDSQVAAAAAISILGRSRRTDNGEEEPARPTQVNFGPGDLSGVDSLHHPHLDPSFLAPARARRGVVHVSLPAFRFPTAVMLSAADAPNAEVLINGPIENEPDTPPAGDLLTPEEQELDESSEEEVSLTLTTPDVQRVEHSVYVEEPQREHEQILTHIRSTDTENKNDEHAPDSVPVPAAERVIDETVGVVIRLKFLDDTQKEVRTELTTTIAVFRSVHFPAAVAEGKVVRLIFQGQLLRDDSRSLESYGLFDRCVVHCHISNTPYAQPNNGTSSVATSTTRPPQFAVRSHGGSGGNVLATAARTRSATRIDYGFARIIFAVLIGQLEQIPLQMRVWYLSQQVRIFNYLQPRPNSSNLYRRFHTAVIVPLLPVVEDDVMDPGERHEAEMRRRAGQPMRPFCIGDHLMLIFGVQCVMIWAFVLYFPQLCDRTAFGLLALLTLYFIFVVLRNSLPANRVPVPETSAE